MTDWYLAAWRKHLVLFKNSSALTITTGGSAALGFLYWWLAARSFSPEVIGIASAILSLMGFIAAIGQGGIGTLLIGEIVVLDVRARGLISAGMIMGSMISLLIGIVLIWAGGSMLKITALDTLLIFIGCGLTGLTIVIDQAFIGMLQSTLRLVRQFLFSLLKILFVVIAAWWISDESAILLSWVVALFLSLFVCEYLMHRRGTSLIHRPDFSLLYGFRRKVFDHYLLDLGTMAPGMILPYLVTVLLSPSDNAVFTVIWMFVVVAIMVPSSVTTVLFPDIRALPEHYNDKMTLSLGASMLFALAFAALVFFYSVDILRIFNPMYADIAGTHLRYLGCGLFGAVVKLHVCAAARLNNRMRQTSIWFCLAGLIELGGAALGCKINGLEGLTLGWSMVMLVEGAMMMLIANPLRPFSVNRNFLQLP